MSVGIIAAAAAAAFQLFSICGAQNVFQEQILLDTSRADSSMDELALKSLLRKSLNHPEESRISGICSKSHFLLKKIVLFEENIFVYSSVTSVTLRGLFL